MKFGVLIATHYFSVMETTLTIHDKNVIRDIVKHYVACDRVRALRMVFGWEVSYQHFIFLGEEIGREKITQRENENWRLVSRMKALAVN